MEPRNILIIKLRYIGDVLLATPVLRALQERYPTAKLTMMVNRGTEDVIKGNPDVNEVLAVDRGGIGAQLGLFSQIRKCRFDCVIDLTDGDRSAILTWISGAPMRIGFNSEHRWRGHLYTHVVKPGIDVHRIERNLAALWPLGIEAKAGPLLLYSSADDERQAERRLREIGVMDQDGRISRPLVVFHPGARYWFKAWPAERFAQLADRLMEACGCQVMIAGGPDDIDTANAIRERATSSPAVLAGRATLPEFAAVLKRCALFVGNDTGAMHMAAAVGTPVVGLFGPSNPAEWGPRGERVSVIYKGVDCRACFHPTCRRGEENCMKQITVEEVFALAMRMIGLHAPVERLQL